MIPTRADTHLSGLLAALADPTRRRIVELLAQAPRAATELYGEFDIAGPAVSRHLRVLREAGVVTDEHVEGDRRVRLYRLTPGALDALTRWLGDLGGGDWQRQLDAFGSFVATRTARPKKGQTR